MENAAIMSGKSFLPHWWMADFPVSKPEKQKVELGQPARSRDRDDCNQDVKIPKIDSGDFSKVV